MNNTGILGEKELRVLLVGIETSRFGRHGRLCRLTKSVVTNFLHTAWIGILMHNDDVTESGKFLSHACLSQDENTSFAKFKLCGFILPYTNVKFGFCMPCDYEKS